MNFNYKKWVATAAISVLAAWPATAAEELKVSTFVVADQALLQVVRDWATMIEEKSNGELTFAYFPSSQMGPPNRQFDLARTGVADISLFLHGFTPGRFPLTELTYLPGTFASVSVENGAKALWGLADEYLTKEHDGTKLLAISPTGAARIFGRKAFTDAESLRGKRIRHPGAVIADTYAAFGAVPVGVPPQEMGDAVQKGLVDGLGVSFQAAEDWKMQDTITNVFDVRFGVASFGVVINKERFDSLSEDLQKLITETTGESMSMAIGHASDLSEAAGRESFKDIIELSTPDDAEMAKFEAVFAERRIEGVAAQEKAGQPAKKFYETLQGEVAKLAE